MDTYSANEIIEMAVQIEKNGYHFYQEALKRHDLDTETKELLEFLSSQEKKHEQIFLNMRNMDDKFSLDSSNNWEAVSSFMKAIVDGRIFSSTESAINKVKTAKSKEDLLYNALSFEKDTLLYFHSIHSLSDEGHVKDLLEDIIVEEMSHIVKLALFIDKK